MAKYRKLPVEIEAFQYDGDLQDKNGNYYVPEWAVNAYKSGVMYYDVCDLYIKTLEGDRFVNVGDFVIQGVKGELYPCKEDIFKITYEKI